MPAPLAKRSQQLRRREELRAAARPPARAGGPGLRLDVRAACRLPAARRRLGRVPGRQLRGRVGRRLPRRRRRCIIQLGRTPWPAGAAAGRQLSAAQGGRQTGRSTVQSAPASSPRGRWRGERWPGRGGGGLNPDCASGTSTAQSRKSGCGGRSGRRPEMLPDGSEARPRPNAPELARYRRSGAAGSFRRRPAPRRRRSRPR